MSRQRQNVLLRARNFTQRHQSLIEYLTIGLIVSVFVAHIPRIGKLASEITLLIAALCGASKDDRR